MRSGEFQLGDLLQESRFRVPQYQRAYAWEQASHVSQFFSDLDQHARLSGESRPYFLGTFLLMATTDGSDSGPATTYAVVDGQQRMTTAFVFVACAIKALRNKDASPNFGLSPSFIGERGWRRFRTIDEDDNFFDEYILGDAVPDAGCTKTPSQRRLLKAKFYLDKELNDRLIEDIEALLSVLLSAKVLAYLIASAIEATQIFEYQNDRGKRLTNLESLKCYIMHRLQLYCPEKSRAESFLAKVQHAFAYMYRTLDQMESEIAAPGEDAILRYHLIADCPHAKVSVAGVSVEGWDYPKAFVEKALSDDSLRRGFSEAEWLLDFSLRLGRTFERVRAILQARDLHPEISGIFVLDRAAAFWPLLIACWMRDDGGPNFLAVCAILRRLAFRSAVAGVRTDMNVADLIGKANTFNGDFPVLLYALDRMSEADLRLKERFEPGLDTANFYKSRAASRFLLWHYENHLRARRGHKAQPQIAWHELFENADRKLDLTVDHIFPQNPSDAGDQAMMTSEVVWLCGDKPSAFSEACLNRMGNLVLDTRAGNAAKGSRRFAEQTTDKRYGFMQSQHELSEDESKVNGVSVWDCDAIKRRHSRLKRFALEV